MRPWAGLSAAMNDRIARAIVALLLLGGACSKPSKRSEESTQGSAVCDVSGSDHDASFRRGADLIGPHMLLMDRKAAPPSESDVRVGIACLDRVLEIDPSNWSALWIRGKAFQSMREHAKAVESFRSAYRLKPENPDVAREFVEELLETQQFREAVAIAREVSDHNPRDAGLKANLALAQLMSGDAPSAQQNIAEALQLERISKRALASSRISACVSVSPTTRFSSRRVRSASCATTISTSAQHVAHVVALRRAADGRPS